MLNRHYELRWVSILIVLDVILEGRRAYHCADELEGFNPYCVGCNLRSDSVNFAETEHSGFNPYCVGCNLRSGDRQRGEPVQHKRFNPYCVGGCMTNCTKLLV